MLVLAIGLSAGAMVFVSLVEVLTEADYYLRKANLSAGAAKAAAYGSFFGGILIAGLLDLYVGFVLSFVKRAVGHLKKGGTIKWKRKEKVDVGTTRGAPSPEIEEDRTIAERNLDEEVSLEMERPEAAESATPDEDVESGSNSSVPDDQILELPPVVEEAPVQVHSTLNTALVQPETSRLGRTSLLVGLALSLHNLPEGLATFIGYIASPATGVTLAVAVAVHNIPEGIAVGVPVYYATGSKWRAIFWAGVSGAAEPLGALIGFAMYSSGSLNDVAMGVVLGIVGGIMVGITFSELIPSAMAYDPRGKLTAVGVMLGMLLMAFSLVLLELFV
jgi:zinc transporter ZupT